MGTGGTSGAETGRGGAISGGIGGSGVGGLSVTPSTGGTVGAGGAETGGRLGTGGTTSDATGGTPSGTGGANAGGTPTSSIGGANAGGSSARTGGTNAGGNSARTGGANAGGAAGVGGQATGGEPGATGGSTGVTCSTTPPTSSAFTADSTGVTFTVGTGRMRIQVCKEDILRVQYTSTSTIPTKSSLSVSATWGTVPFCVTEASGTATITTARMKAKVVEGTGVVTYADLSDNVILAESSKSTTATTVEGTSTYTIKTAFNAPANEALYGTGQHQDNNMNLKGKSEQLLNANTNINIPMLVSNKGYGIFWDNSSTSNFSSTSSTTSYSSECGEGVDYYFFYGPSIDQVVALYRTTTGAAPLFPKWAYGLFQSKDHYSSQTEFLNVVSGYRNANIPVDVVVQDWDYWGSYSWGSHIMAPSRYPNPTTIVSTMHTDNIHGMISIWPLYQLWRTRLRPSMVRMTRTTTTHSMP